MDFDKIAVLSWWRHYMEKASDVELAFIFISLKELLN